MCGIAGLLDLRRAERDPAAAARRMADAIPYRGPDGAGAWGDAEAGIGLGHRRLAIVDLSPTGAQPMHSADGRYVISFNGEVYNFRELRGELESSGATFRGTSDTEVMLAAFAAWGVLAATERFIGMFAFAVFDRQTRKLHLVRDRLGIKPLYWTFTGDLLLFGSEMRALMAHAAFRKDVDPEAADALLRYGYIPAPATIFRGVHKLAPGSVLSIGPDGAPSVAPWWQLDRVVTQPARTIGEADAARELDILLQDAVRRRMVADVPVGAFLSGGVDSSTIVALMQACAERPIRTFTIGFKEATYDEAPHARAVASHLGTAHTEVVLDERAALDLIGDIPFWFDEPFADSSQLPTYLVSRMTREHVTVALSGDGGDELFGGYPKYAAFAAMRRRTAWMPASLRLAAGGAMRNLPEPLLAAGARLIEPGRAERLGEKARRLGAAIAAHDEDDALDALDAVGTAGARLALGARGALRPQRIAGLAQAQPDLISRMQARDMAGYLPDDILTKVDRCSMTVSLEARVPLLDHRVVEFVWSLPPDIRRGRTPKALLKAVLGRYMPLSLVERPKRGFSVPVGQWLAGPLRDWAENLLSPVALRNDGLLDVGAVRELWHRHLTKREQNATALWHVLMLRAWSEHWLSP